MTQPLSVVLVGGGRIAVGNIGLAGDVPLSHAAAIQAVGDTVAQLAAVVEPEPSRRAKLAQDGLPVVADLAEVPARPSDVVVIATPSNIRKQPFELALARKPSAIVVEKPLSPASEEAREMVRLAEKAGVPVFVNYNRRTDDRMRDWIGRLQQAGVKGVHVAYGRGLANYASHAIDLIRFGWGDVRSIRWLSGEAVGNPATDPSPSFAMTMENGVTAIFQGYEGLSYDLLDLRFQTALGEVTFLAGGAEILDRRAEPGRYYDGYSHLGEGTSDRAPVAGFTGLYRQLQTLLTGGGGSDLCFGTDALATAAVLDAVKQSSKRDGASVRPAHSIGNGKE